MVTSHNSHQALGEQPNCVNDTEGPVTVGERIDRISDAAQTAWKASHDAATELRRLLDIGGRVDRSPYVTMAAAAGAGYVLAGGLFSPLTVRIVGLGLRLGLRLLAVPFIQRELFGGAEPPSATVGGTPASGCGASCTNEVNQERHRDEYQ